MPSGNVKSSYFSGAPVFGSSSLPAPVSPLAGAAAAGSPAAAFVAGAAAAAAGLVSSVVAAVAPVSVSDILCPFCFGLALYRFLAYLGEPVGVHRLDLTDKPETNRAPPLSEGH